MPLPTVPRRAWRLAVCALAGLSLIACGKKGPPRPPLVRIPSPVASIAVKRVGDDVFLSFRVPSQNADGSTPVDVATIEVFALTTDRPPARQAFLQRATRIATLNVKVPAPAATAAAAPLAGSVAPVLPAAAPADVAPSETVAPGEEVTVREELKPGTLVPVTLPVEPQRGTPSSAQAPAPSSPAPTSASAPPATPPQPRRYYVAVASSPRQRSSPNGAQASVSVAPPPDTPSPPDAVTDEHTLTLTWNAVPGAVAYNVYRTTSEEPAQEASPSLRAVSSTPLNAAPLESATLMVPVEFGAQVCYRIGAVRRDTAGELVESRPSAARCVTPIDTFAPKPPVGVTVVPGAGAITVGWTRNTEPDLAGYLVLRGAPGDATLAQITASPIAVNRFVDRDVMSGVRYVYAVVAVDAATPVPNRSAPSARDETTAR